MPNRICPHCGDPIGEFCLNEGCKNASQKDWENKVNNKIVDYQSEVSSLKTTDANILTLEDFSELRKIKLAINKWTKDRYAKNSPVLAEVNKLLQEIEETENKFPPRIKLQYQKRGQSCRHDNIDYNEFFISFKDKKQVPYCLDCGENENSEFTKKFQIWYCEKISKWLSNKGLNKFDFANFLKKKDYYDNWCELRQGKFFIENSIRDVLVTFQELSTYIEEYCLEFAKDKGANVNNNSSKTERERERERERKRAKIIFFALTMNEKNSKSAIYFFSPAQKLPKKKIFCQENFLI